ncbi:MAG: hypothetical protein U0736_01265 [Gemmataceae bacterium]
MVPLLLFALLAPPDVEPPDPRPTFKVTLRKPADRLEVVHRKGEVAWRITSRTGIGTADVRLSGGESPRVPSVEFPPARGLESFSLDDGRGKMEAHLDREHGRTVRHFNARGRLVDQPTPNGATLTVEPLAGGGIRAVFASDRPAKRWSLHWIDFYRR